MGKESNGSCVGPHTTSIATYPYPNERADKLIMEIEAELTRAEALHPDWPSDIIHQVSIMMEEAGESVREANNIAEGKCSTKHLREELIQTGAMVLRCLKNL